MSVNGILLGQGNSSNNLIGKFLKNRTKLSFFQKTISLNLSTYDYFALCQGYLVIFHYGGGNAHTLKRQKINMDTFTLEPEESLSSPVDLGMGFPILLESQGTLFFTMNNIYKISTDIGKTWVNLTLDPNIKMNSYIFSIGDGFLYLPINSSKTLQKLTIKNNTLEIVEENHIWSIKNDVTLEISSTGLNAYYSPYSYFYHIPSNTLFSKNTRNTNIRSIKGTRNHIFLIYDTFLTIFNTSDTSLSSPIKTIKITNSSNAGTYWHTLDYFFYMRDGKTFCLDDATLTEIEIAGSLDNYNNRACIGIISSFDFFTQILLYDYKTANNAPTEQGKLSLKKIVPQYEIFIENQSIGKIPSDLEFNE